jgi:uncharacterized membrane protein YkoI
MFKPQSAVVVILLAAAVTAAQEKKIQRSDLPPAVEATVSEQSQGATIKGFSQEQEHGQTFYEAEMTVNRHSKDILIDTHGAVVEIEEQVALDSLPAAVQQGLQAKAGSGKILKVESLTKHGKLVSYEAKVQTAAKKKEITVDADGKPLAHED